MPLKALSAGESTWSDSFVEGETALADQKLDLAESSFRKALSAAESSHISGDIEKCKLRLADILALKNKTEEAQALYEQLLDSLTKQYGAGSAQIAAILVDLGSIQEAAGDHTAAIKYYARALQINEKNFGPYSPAVAGNLRNLGRASYKAGNKSAAEKHFKRSQSILALDPTLKASGQLESLAKDYGDLLKGNDNTPQNLLKDFQTDILQNKNKATPVAEKLRQAEQKQQRPSSRIQVEPAQQKETFSDTSAWQALSRSRLNKSGQSQTNEEAKVVLRELNKPASDTQLAPAYKIVNDSIFMQSHYEKGESYYQRTIAADIDALGLEHPSLANDLNGLAQLYVSQEKYSQAQPLLARALSIYEKLYGAANLLTINTSVTLARVEFQLGHIEKAQTLYRSALSDGQSVLGPNSFETARILNELAYLYFHQGKLQESRTVYQWALASTEGALGSQNPMLAACLKDYARVLRSLGQNNEASDSESHADKILSTSH